TAGQIDEDAAPHADPVQQHVDALALTERFGDECRLAVMELDDGCRFALGSDQAGRHISSLSEWPSPIGTPVSFASRRAGSRMYLSAITATVGKDAHGPTHTARSHAGRDGPRTASV